MKTMPRAIFACAKTAMVVGAITILSQCCGRNLAADEDALPVTLGITVADKESADTALKAMGAPTLKGRRCIVVTEVDPKGPCGGKLVVNNAVISIGDIPTPDVDAFNAALKELKPGLEVQIKGLYLGRGEDGQPRWTPGNIRVVLAAPPVAKPVVQQDKPKPSARDRADTDAPVSLETQPDKPTQSPIPKEHPPAVPEVSGPRGTAATDAAASGAGEPARQADEVLTAEWFPFRDGATAEYKISARLEMTQEWLYKVKDGVPTITPRMTEMGGRTVSNWLAEQTYVVDGKDVILNKGTDNDCAIKTNARVGDTWKSGAFTYTFKGFEKWAIFLYKGADPGPERCAVIRVEARVNSDLVTSEDRFYAKGIGLLGKKVYDADGNLMAHWVVTKCARDRMTATEKLFWGVTPQEQAKATDPLPGKPVLVEQAFDPADVEACARLEKQFDECTAKAKQLKAEGDQRGYLAELKKASSLALDSIDIRSKYKSQEEQFRAAVEKAKAAMK